MTVVFVAYTPAIAAVVGLIAVPVLVHARNGRSYVVAGCIAVAHLNSALRTCNPIPSAFGRRLIVEKGKSNSLVYGVYVIGATNPRVGIGKGLDEAVFCRRGDGSKVALVAIIRQGLSRSACVGPAGICRNQSVKVII